MAITFNITRHTTRDTEVVEVFRNDELIATIYPDDGIPSLKVVSKYLDLKHIVADALMVPAVLMPFSC